MAKRNLAMPLVAALAQGRQDTYRSDPESENPYWPSAARFERMHAMRPISAWAAICGLLLAVVYGPMFHVHIGDDHGDGSLLHAHFPDLPHLETEPGPEIEDNHDHGGVRSFDFFTSNAPTLVHVGFVAVEEPFILEVAVQSAGFVFADEPRAHAPPLVASSIPRSPPV
jgi:hypothetical protein